MKASAASTRIGRPLAGQQALDIFQCATWVRQEFTAHKILLEAKGNFGLASLLAAGQSRHIDGGEIDLPIASFRTVLHEQGDNALAEIPGLFEWFDIPQLIARWPSGRVYGSRSADFNNAFRQQPIVVDRSGIQRGSSPVAS